MGTRSSHAPGLFCWVDVQTPDVKGAHAFYRKVLGWTISRDSPMATVKRRPVAAIVPLAPDSEHPARFNSYVSVVNADGICARAEQLGATVIEKPFDVGPAGRLALMSDPAGALLCLWEPGEHPGAGRVNEPGCLTWNELNVRDAGPALGFYSGLFGWTYDDAIDTGDGGSYRTIRNGGRMNGGIRSQPGPELQAGAPHWLPYFAAESTERAAERAADLGGRVQMPPTRLPTGARIAVLADPQGAMFAVFEGETED